MRVESHVQRNQSHMCHSDPAGEIVGSAVFGFETLGGAVWDGGSSSSATAITAKHTIRRKERVCISTASSGIRCAHTTGIKVNRE